MAYPTTTSSFTIVAGTTLLATVDHADFHNVLGSAVVSLENKVGLGAGTPTANKALIGSGNGTAVWGTAWNAANLGTAVITTSTFSGGTVTGGLIGTVQITGGTVANAVLGTPTMDVWTTSGTTITSHGNRAISVPVGTLTDAPGGTIAINCPSAQLFEITMGTTAGNRTLGTPSNAVDGLYLGLRVKQNVNNTGTVVYPAIYRFFPSGTPTLGTQGTWLYEAFRYNETDTKWDFQGYITGLI